MKIKIVNHYLFNRIKSYSYKKSKKITLLSGFVFFLILACGNGSDKTSDNLKPEKPLEEKTNKASSNDCLEQFYGKPENLLTKEMVAKYVDFQGAEVEYMTLAIAFKKEELSKGYLSSAFVSFKWEINRQRHKVSLGSIDKIKLYKSKTPVDRFYAKYHTKTPEEQAALKKLYDSLVLNSEPVKSKTDKSNAIMLSEAIGFNFAYLPVDDIGDAAVWEYKVNDLKVLVGEYQFTVNVDLNKGNDYDLEKAKLIAKAIIEKACK